ncbi:MAG: thioredoxin [Bacteroidales bacterium]|nr:thioredoxin [Bacteroidales bacterium]
MVTVVNDDNASSVLATDKPVMLDLGAVWCGPCQALAPTIDEMATEYEGRAVVAKADVEESPDLAARYRVRNVPTVLFLKGGEVVDKSVGLVPKATLAEKLNALL